MLEGVPIKHMFRYSNLTGSAKAENRMSNLMNRNESRRSLRSVMKSLVAVGATSALMLAGLAFAASSPASAATTLTFSTITSPQTAGSDLNFTVTPANGSTTDTVGITSACGLGGTTSAPTTGGVATFTGLFIKLGTSCTLTATVTAGPDVGSTAPSNTFTVNAGAAAEMAFTTAPPANATVGVALTTFKVSVEDAYGNLVTSGTGSVDTITISTGSAGCTVGGTDTATASGGGATFSAVDISAGTTCALTATDTLNPDNTFTPVTSAAINVATTTPNKVGFTTEPSAAATAGAILPSFAVSIEESNGIPITASTGDTDVVVITSTCTLIGTTTVAAIAGVATFTALAIKTGTICTLVATDSTRIIATASSTAINVAAGAPTQVVFTTAPPTAVATASTVLTAFKASVEDVNGNVVTSGIGAADTIAITSPCTLGGTTTAAAVAGVATFAALTVNVTGACVLTATDSARTLTVATATSTVGTPQAALVLNSVKGTVGKALNLTTSGGTGTGTLTYTVAAGSSAGCTVSGTSLSAKRAGTCLVTATKAGTTVYIVVSSAATKVTFVLPFKASRVAGAVTVGTTSTVTIVGSGFSGRPRIICNVAGVTANVTRDTGKALTIKVAVRAGVKTGVHTFTVILANGKRTSVKFSLR